MEMKKILTLCMIYQHPKILLGMKKRGFGKDIWNGFGGKLNDGESIEEAAIREVREETGIKINKIEKKGIIDFEFKDNPEILEVHIFKADEFEGEPLETEEMRPKWFHIDEIPFEEMWSDDIHWLPLFLDGKKFRGKFLFDDADSNKILDLELLEVEEI